MSGMNVPPICGVKISEEDYKELSLHHFHLVLLVEPDAAMYAPLAGDGAQQEELIALINQLIIEELYDDDQLGIETPDDVDETWVVSLRNRDTNFFGPEVEGYVHGILMVNYLFNDYWVFKLFMKGVYQAHPEWRIAVIGAMMEGEVTRVANLVHKMGFDATILTRYCLSGQAFVNWYEVIDDSLEEHPGDMFDKEFGLES